MTTYALTRLKCDCSTSNYFTMRDCKKCSGTGFSDDYVISGGVLEKLYLLIKDIENYSQNKFRARGVYTGLAKSALALLVKEEK